MVSREKAGRLVDAGHVCSDASPTNTNIDVRFIKKGTNLKFRPIKEETSKSPKANNKSLEMNQSLKRATSHRNLHEGETRVMFAKFRKNAPPIRSSRNSGVQSSNTSFFDFSKQTGRKNLFDTTTPHELRFTSIHTYGRGLNTSSGPTNLNSKGASL